MAFQAQRGRSGWAAAPSGLIYLSVCECVSVCVRGVGGPRGAAQNPSLRARPRRPAPGERDGYELPRPLSFASCSL